MSRMRRRVEWTFFDTKITKDSKDTKDTKGRFAPKPVGTARSRLAGALCAPFVCFVLLGDLRVEMGGTASVAAAGLPEVTAAAQFARNVRPHLNLVRRSL